MLRFYWRFQIGKGTAALASEVRITAAVFFCSSYFPSFLPDSFLFLFLAPFLSFSCVILFKSSMILYLSVFGLPRIFSDLNAYSHSMIWSSLWWSARFVKATDIARSCASVSWKSECALIGNSLGRLLSVVWSWGARVGRRKYRNTIGQPIGWSAEYLWLACFSIDRLSPLLALLRFLIEFCSSNRWTYLE